MSGVNGRSRVGGAVLGIVVGAVLIAWLWAATPADDGALPTTTAFGLGRPDRDAPVGPGGSVPTATPTPSRPDSEPALSATTAPPRFDAESHMFIQETALFSVRYPASWFLAAGDGSLTPNLGWHAISVGSFPLRPGGDRCANWPVNALEDMGSGDALVTVFVGGGSGAPPSRVFGPDFPPLAPGHEALECLEPPADLDMRWGESWDHGRPFYVLAVFGRAASDAVRQEAWEILNGLTLTWPDEPLAVQPRGSAGCDPPSPYDTSRTGLGAEVFVTATPRAAWAHVPAVPPLPVETELDITWSVAADQLTNVYLVSPNTTLFPQFEQIDTTWNPASGTTWQTTVVFPEPGCWEVRMVADGGSFTGWLEVR